MPEVTFKNHVIRCEGIVASHEQVTKHYEGIKGIEILERPSGNSIVYKYVDAYEYIAMRTKIRNKRRK